MNKVENSERANNALRLKQMEQFFGELFDIAICRCRDLRRCNCPREHRVPEAEKRFLRDQRSARRMFVTRRNDGSGMSSSHPAAATSGGSLQSAQQASDSEGTEVATSDSDSVCRRCWKFHRRRSGLATKRQRYRRGGHADADKHRTPTEPIQHLKPGSDWHIVRVSIRHRPHIGRTRGLHPGN